MTPSDGFFLALALIAGAFAGVVFFGGLWLTVKRMLTARQPALLMIASLIVRAGIVLLIFYLVAAGEVLRIVASLVGFLLVRFFMVRYFEPESKTT
jgi:F1F0 ATPase subunit 2